MVLAGYKIATISYPKRFILLLGALTFFLLLFWLGSRYPQLLHKLSLAPSAKVSSSITLKPLFTISDSALWWDKLYYGALNWYSANKIGMTFGITMGAAIISLFRNIERKFETSNMRLNSLFGMLFGAPLGVCVNCATPVAQGVYRGGSRVETSLAMMMSSPTLNVVVLMMGLTLFPLPMIVLKYALTIFMIVGVLPWLVKKFPLKSSIISLDTETCSIPSGDQLCSIDGSNRQESWMQALKKVVVQYGKDLFYIVKLTVPLMILAGFLASALGNFFPLAALLAGEPSLFKVLGVIVIGVLAPLPVAFDIILAHSLLTAGVSVQYVMPLLFGFGIFSVYPLGVIGSSMSWRLSFGLFFSVVILSFASSFLIQLF